MSLSCETVRERLADGESGNELVLHLSGCEECSAFVASLDALDDELSSLPRIDAPDALVEKTLARIDAEEERAAKPVEVSSPSILVAAFATLTAALGALIVAPLTFVQWIVTSARAVRPAPPPSAAAAEAPPDFRRRMPSFGATFAVGSFLCAFVLFMTFQRVGHTVKTKVRGAESVIAALPTTSDEGAGSSGDYWRMEDMEEAAEAPAPTPAATAAFLPAAQAADDRNGLDIDGLRGELGGEGVGDEIAQGVGGRYGIEGPTTTAQPFATAIDRSGSIDIPEVYNGRDDGDGRGEEGRVSLAEGEGQRGLGWTGEQAGDDDREQAVAVTGEREHLDALRTPSPDVVPRVPPARPGSTEGDFQQLDQPTQDATLAVAEDYRALSARWIDAQRTTALSFHPHDGWWQNTYVPGDAAMRVLHARLAAAGDRRLSGVAYSALSLAETSAPTVPAVAAPTDRAIAVGVHADVAAIEGPTRVRMEVAVRGITQPAGRRGALRVALVIDATDGLDDAAQTRIRSIVTALSRSTSSRDRVMLVAAGPHGGTLVELGAMRSGQMEIALRHLFAGDGTGDATTLQAAVEGALEGVASDDGASLLLLATPDGDHDAALDQALHVGAVAGVVTSAVGLSSSVTLAELDAIALAGQGRRCLVLTETDATTAVRSELTATARLIARALRIRVRLAPGVELIDVLGSRALDADESRRTRETERAIDQQLARRLGIGADRDDDQDGIRILLPSFYSGDSHTVMLDLLVSRPGPVADVDVQFKDLVRLGNGSASSALSLASGTSPRGPHEQRVVASFLAHEVASALETAGDRVAAGDWAGARVSIQEARALIGAARTELPALATSRSVQADDALLGLYLAALSGGDAALVADSLHYAAHRRLVLPQLALGGQ